MFSLETWYLGHKGGRQIGARLGVYGLGVQWLGVHRLGVHRLGVQWREPEREKA
jgi:hypothetical protein